MAWQLTIYTVVGLVAAFISGLVALLAWEDRETAGALPFTGLMVALGSWSLVYAVQLGFTTAAGQLPWQRVALAIGGTIPTLWFVFSLRYTGKDDWLTDRWLALLAVDPVAFGVLTLTNDAHGLIWRGATLLPDGPPVVTLSLAVGYYVHILYAYVIIAAGLGLLALVSERTASLYRRQTLLLILGTLPPFLGNMGFTLRLDVGPLPALDPTPFAFVITGVLFGLALFQFDLLDRTPIAQRLVFEELGLGLVILDDEGTVAEANSVARELLDDDLRVGSPVSGLRPDGGRGEVDDDGDGDDGDGDDGVAALDGTTLTATMDGRRRTYDVRSTPLTDHRGETAGQVIAYRDVTDREGYEQRLEVAARVLRHNLRNDMNVIRGWAEELREAEGCDSEGPEFIIETADRLIDLSEKTRQIVDLDGLTEGDPVDVDLASSLRAIVAEHRQDHPDARFETDFAAVQVRVPDHDIVSLAVGNLVENALEHGDDESPLVRVTAERDGDMVAIRVADDGPGIPEMEREVLRRGEETPLHHGRGVGLWLTYWCVTVAGGEISFAERSPRGSVVTLTFPAADRTG